MPPRTLRKQDRVELAEWVAARGQNYELYKQWAARKDFYVFTKAYLHNWCNRHRNLIRLARERQREEFRQMTVFHRAKRIEMMEQNVRRIDGVLERLFADEDHFDPDKANRLMEQQRKLLQAIATERGEWNRAPEGDEESPLAAVLQRMLDAAPKGAIEAPPVDAEYREVQEVLTSTD